MLQLVHCSLYCPEFSVFAFTLFAVLLLLLCVMFLENNCNYFKCFHVITKHLNCNEFALFSFSNQD